MDRPTDQPAGPIDRGPDPRMTGARRAGWLVARMPRSTHDRPTKPTDNRPRMPRSPDALMPGQPNEQPTYQLTYLTDGPTTTSRPAGQPQPPPPRPTIPSAAHAHARAQQPPRPLHEKCNVIRIRYTIRFLSTDDLIVYYEDSVYY